MGVKVGWNNSYIAAGGTVCVAPQEKIQEEKLLNRRVNRRVALALAEAWSPASLQEGVTFDRSTLSGLSPSSLALDMSESQQIKVLEQSYYLYKTNPLAMAAIEIMTDFVTGEGFSFEATGKLQDEFEKFWNNPNNNWEIRQENKVRELGLYGVQYYPVAINSMTGRVELGYLDPARVKDVIFLEGNTEVIDRIVLHPDKNGETKTMKVIRQDPKTGKLIGEVFYFSVNRVSNAKFGTSDLLSSFEWMDIYDQFLFNAAERTLLQDAYVWDYTWTGLTESQIESKSRNYRSAPKPGSSRHHNEKVDIKAIGPNHNGNQNTKIMADLIKMYAIMGMRIPEHWLSDGGDVNFATAKAMGTPIFKMLRRRQKLWVAQLDLIFRYVAEQALDRDMIDQAEFDAGWRIIPSEISVEDHVDRTLSLRNVGETLALAELQGWVSREQASDAYVQAANRLNVEIRPQDTLPQDRNMAQQVDSQTDGDPEPQLPPKPQQQQDPAVAEAVKSYEEYRKELAAA